ncbi:MAG: thiaminase II [Chloroflexi bacterium]|nr:thiaminase II [Chloroflexota bacterium]
MTIRSPEPPVPARPAARPAAPARPGGDAGPEPFSARLRRLAEAVWQAQHAHPFVRGIGDGSLDLARFRHWVRQDYRFLVEYCRLFGLAAARAPDLDTLVRFADLLQATARTEMDLHRAYAAELDISPGELEREPMAPTTRAYTDFLVRVAATGDFAELAAALLPCMWGFSEIGQTLAARGLPAEPRYAKWVRMYADPEFATLAGWCRDLVDRLASGVDDATRRRMEDAFLTSSRYEYQFWEMAWRMETWPI